MVGYWIRILLRLWKNALGSLHTASVISVVHDISLLLGYALGLYGLGLGSLGRQRLRSEKVMQDVADIFFLDEENMVAVVTSRNLRQAEELEKPNCAVKVCQVLKTRSWGRLALD